jgi:hypothetical protein
MIVPENAIPAGSLPPETGQATDQGGEKGSEALILGKFKSAEDMANAYKALEQDHGRLGSELGSARKQNETLLNLVSQGVQGSAAASTPQESTADQIAKIDKELDSIDAAVEAGEMSISEGRKKDRELTRQRTQLEMNDQFAKAKSQNDAAGMVANFKAAHPDFQQALDSGALEEIKKANPLHDNISAYYEWKANEAIAGADAREKTAFEKGKAEISSLAAGSQATNRVLGRSGSEVRVTNAPAPGPLNSQQMSEGMMGVLRGVRGGT